MTLPDIIGKPISDMDAEELEKMINSLKNAKVITHEHVTPSKKKLAVAMPKKVKSNKDRQVEDLIKNLDAETLAQLALLIQKGAK